MKLIDADALVDALMMHEWYDEDGWVIDDAEPKREYIKKWLPDISTVSGWIRVKDRLPDRQTPVIVYVPPYSDDNEEYIGYVGMAYYTHSARGGYWAGSDGNVYGAIGIIHEPTHWMPMPEPPKEVEE